MDRKALIKLISLFLFVASFVNTLCAEEKLYFKLGYQPDGQGIVGIAGKSYPLDDDLILWLVKSFN